ncbi:MFS transporter [Alteromonas sp. C1M14]|uniref:MFS transporter n=1 Tax=Alteromonas sp. C1M14 TaxID=2841567 RepID=UPI001C081FFD|nr:MFS transporter [Alteromonas sp. C1M14]MBU2979569.1 MFS transporter [Alteromonas sp. C1M14]
MNNNENNSRESIHPGSWIPSMYFAMGLPFVVIAQASALMYKNLGVSDTQIALWTSLIMLPWTLKPLWSPLLEMFRTQKYFVIATQLFTGITFVLVAFTLPLDNFFQYSIALLGLVALSGATHDIAADGVYINVLSSEEQAKYIGWQGAAYNIAKIVSGGAFVYVAGELEKTIGVISAWSMVMSAYGICMLVMGIYHIKFLPKGKANTNVKSLKEGLTVLVDVIKTFFSKKYVIWYVVFIMLYRFAEGFAIKIAPLFFKASTEQGGLGLDTSEIGVIYGTFGAGAFVIGSLLGGYYISSKGLKQSLFRLALVFNIPFAVYTLLAMFQPDQLWVISLAVVFEYFGYGFGFVALILFMMQQIAPGKYRTAHYAFATGIMNLGFMLPSMMSGVLSDWLGYEKFFIWVLIATVPSLLVAKYVPFNNSLAK